MNGQSTEKTYEDGFWSDLQSDWNEPLKSQWSNTVEHSNELYDNHKVGDVKNVLCLRLFASSLYEIANGSKDARKLMVTIFGESLIRNISTNDIKIYESLVQTVQYLAWKIRKADIIKFRRTSENHGWSSVRHILVKILANDKADHEKVVAGMCATILHDIYRCHISNLSFREDSSLLPKSRFNDVFRVAFPVFNDAIVEYIQKGKKEVIYETLASRLVYFYTRLAADTWRILVVRNGPKLETEWYLSRSTEKFQETEPDSSPWSSEANRSSNVFSNNNYSTHSQNSSQKCTDICHINFMRQFAKPIRRNL
ncbi:hypothetical protein L5515_001732 [Caenorhabditis briggsae]|nr:hypothetical protein L5515_001732 [Caenorhabditis briggsae]